MSGETIIKVDDVHVNFSTYGGKVQALRGVSFELKKSETLAIVGESGSGKSVTVNTIMGLLQKPAAVVDKGQILYKDKDLLKLSSKEMKKIQGSKISMIFQDPMTALNPTMKIGEQLVEGIRAKDKVSRKQANARALEMLELVGISNPEERLKQYPHQFSGGMRQRIVIAIALMGEPDVLIADEPTTALDVTIQAQILELFEEIQKRTGVSIILITHDLGVVAKVANRIAVMYAGKIVEYGDKRDLFYRPNHPYTQGLLNSVPRLDLKDEELVPIEGSPPDLFSPPKGCPFASRCQFAMKVCEEVYPDATAVDEGHTVFCWLKDERAQEIFALQS